MARKEKVTKPIFEVKHDFVDSLDALLHEALNFYQAVQTAIELGQVSDKVKPILQERVDAFRKKLSADA